jgi:hypothetical protein
MSTRGMAVGCAENGSLRGRVGVAGSAGQGGGAGFSGGRTGAGWWAGAGIRYSTTETVTSMLPRVALE